MSIYVVALIAVVALALGWLAGVWTFRRSLSWCDICGHNLACPQCKPTIQVIRTNKAEETADERAHQ